MTLQLLNRSDCEYGFLSSGGAFIRFWDIVLANDYADHYSEELAITAQKLNGPVKIFYGVGNEDYFEFPKWLAENYTLIRIGKMANELWFGDVGISQELIDLAQRLFENPKSGGIVRMTDGKQIILHDESRASLKFASITDATNWERRQYYHPGDLETFLRRCQQELEPNNPFSIIENTYRVFHPDLGMESEEGWMRVSTRFTLYEVNGEFYQMGENLNFEDISRPTDLRV